MDTENKIETVQAFWLILKKVKTIFRLLVGKTLR